MIKYNKDPSILPEIILPTLNGEHLISLKLVNRTPDFVLGKLLPRLDEDEDDYEDEDEEMMEDEGQDNIPLPHGSEEMLRDFETGENDAFADTEEDSYDSSIKPSHESISHNENFDEQTITIIKPDISEVTKSTNRDTLRYLKAKRIIKRKINDCSDTKKVKSENI